MHADFCDGCLHGAGLSVAVTCCPSCRGFIAGFLAVREGGVPYSCFLTTPRALALRDALLPPEMMPRLPLDCAGMDPLTTLDEVVTTLDEVADEVARTISDAPATDLLLLSPPASPDPSASRRARQAGRSAEPGRHSPATVASKNMESMINTWRGWVCLIVTALSVAIVLQEPRLVLFWRPVGARLTWEETGLPGTLLAGFFVIYLCADTIIACLMRAHITRSLGPAARPEVPCAQHPVRPPTASARRHV